MRVTGFIPNPVFGTARQPKPVRHETSQQPQINRLSNIYPIHPSLLFRGNHEIQRPVRVQTESAERAKKLEELGQQLFQAAKEMGLSPRPVHVYLVDPEHYLTLQSQEGFPERYYHWTWGQDYHVLRIQYEKGRRPFTETVLPGNPVQIFMPETQPNYALKVAMAHAIARSDLFENNLFFPKTKQEVSRKAAQNAREIKSMEFEPGIGEDKVEHTLDVAHSIRYLINVTQPPANLDEAPATPSRQNPERDVLGFLVQKSKALDPWQRRILEIVRDESYGQMPQQRTKLMGDGWAAFWNERINTGNPHLPVEDVTRESILVARIFGTDPVKMNTYQLGLFLMKEMEKRVRAELRQEQPELEQQDRPGFNRQVYQRMREGLRYENDVSFVRNNLSDEVIRRLMMYVYQPKANGEAKPGDKLVITTKECDAIRETLLSQLKNAGKPVISVVDENYQGKGELLLKHIYDTDLKKDFAEQTLRNIEKLWGRPVHLETKFVKQKDEKEESHEPPELEDQLISCVNQKVTYAKETRSEAQDDDIPF